MLSLNDLSVKFHVYSWSTKIDFVVSNTGGFQNFDGSSVCLLWDQRLILTLEKIGIHPMLENSGASGYRLKIDASVTACEAENLGKRLAYALLSVAISRHWGLSLSWQDTPLPCRGIDRTASRGFEMQAFASVVNQISIADFIESLNIGFSDSTVIPYSLLLSMELCASSRFQTDNRAKLILLVSALETCAQQQDISDEVGDLIESLKKMVQSHNLLDKSLQDSLLGQITNLTRESSRRAIKRLLMQTNVKQEDIDFIDYAYQARSKIVHEGQRIPELDIMNNRLDQILQAIYRETFMFQSIN